jgi:hypothetical protein
MTSPIFRSYLVTKFHVNSQLGKQESREDSMFKTEVKELVSEAVYLTERTHDKVKPRACVTKVP